MGWTREWRVGHRITSNVKSQLAPKLRSTMTKTMSMTKLTRESRSPILFFKSNVSAPKRLKWPETGKF